MKTILTSITLIIGLVISGGLGAADAVAEFNKAMAGNDAVAKKKAIAGLSAIKDDDVVLPLLVRAANDRQGQRHAISALRARTGLKPASNEGGNTGYPGYPTEDTGAAWSAWLDARQKELDAKAEREAAMAEAEAANAEAEKANERLDNKGKEGEDTADNQEGTDAQGEGEATAAVPKPDYGKLDRIILKDGGVMTCYILSKRQDLEGNTTSVRVMHRNEGGEETLDAGIIARIEEDVK